MHNRFLIFLFIILCPIISQAQGIPASSRDSTEKDFNFVPVPYINYSRSLGFAGGLIPMAMYKINKSDTISPASITGLMGMYTSNDTWFGMFFHRMYLKEDNWRITTAGGLASVNFQFYLDLPIAGGGFVDYNTQADFFFIEAQRKVHGKLYLGLNYTYTYFNTVFGEDNVIDPEPVTLHGLGVKGSWDRRDDVYYPKSGSMIEVDWKSYPGFLDNEFESNKIEMSFNYFFPARENNDVIAARLKTGLGVGDLSFEQQFIVGREDIRGYTQGQFRGNYLMALQGEYRWNFHKKLSAVGFFGVASVFDSINEEDEGKLLPGIGTGFRYNVFPKYHMNVGMDIAAGKDDWGIYFRVGEAF